MKFFFYKICLKIDKIKIFINYRATNNGPKFHQNSLLLMYTGKKKHITTNRKVFYEASFWLILYSGTLIPSSSGTRL